MPLRRQSKPTTTATSSSNVQYQPANTLSDTEDYNDDNGYNDNNDERYDRNGREAQYGGFNFVRHPLKSAAWLTVYSLSLILALLFCLLLALFRLISPRRRSFGRRAEAKIFAPVINLPLRVLASVYDRDFAPPSERLLAPSIVSSTVMPLIDAVSLSTAGNIEDVAAQQEPPRKIDKKATKKANKKSKTKKTVLVASAVNIETVVERQHKKRQLVGERFRKIESLFMFKSSQSHSADDDDEALHEKKKRRKKATKSDINLVGVSVVDEHKTAPRKHHHHRTVFTSGKKTTLNQADLPAGVVAAGFNSYTDYWDALINVSIDSLQMPQTGSSELLLRSRKQQQQQDAVGSGGTHALKTDNKINDKKQKKYEKAKQQAADASETEPLLLSPGAVAPAAHIDAAPKSKGFASVFSSLISRNSSKTEVPPVALPSSPPVVIEPPSLPPTDEAKDAVDNGSNVSDTDTVVNEPDGTVSKFADTKNVQTNGPATSNPTTNYSADNVNNSTSDKKQQDASDAADSGAVISLLDSEHGTVASSSATSAASTSSQILIQWLRTTFTSVAPTTMTPTTVEAGASGDDKSLLPLDLSTTTTQKNNTAAAVDDMIVDIHSGAAADAGDAASAVQLPKVNEPPAKSSFFRNLFRRATPPTSSSPSSTKTDAVKINSSGDATVENNITVAHHVVELTANKEDSETAKLLSADDDRPLTDADGDTGKADNSAAAGDVPSISEPALEACGGGSTEKQRRQHRWHFMNHWLARRRGRSSSSTSPPKTTSISGVVEQQIYNCVSSSMLPVMQLATVMESEEEQQHHHHQQVFFDDIISTGPDTPPIGFVLDSEHSRRKYNSGLPVAAQTRQFVSLLNSPSSRHDQQHNGVAPTALSVEKSDSSMLRVVEVDELVDPGDDVSISTNSYNRRQQIITECDRQSFASIASRDAYQSSSSHRGGGSSTTPRGSGASSPFVLDSKSLSRFGSAKATTTDDERLRQQPQYVASLNDLTNNNVDRYNTIALDATTSLIDLPSTYKHHTYNATFTDDEITSHSELDDDDDDDEKIVDSIMLEPVRSHNENLESPLTKNARDDAEQLIDDDEEDDDAVLSSQQADIISNEAKRTEHGVVSGKTLFHDTSLDTDLTLSAVEDNISENNNIREVGRLLTDDNDDNALLNCDDSRSSISRDGEKEELRQLNETTAAVDDGDDDDDDDDVLANSSTADVILSDDDEHSADEQDERTDSASEDEDQISDADTNDLLQTDKRFNGDTDTNLSSSLPSSLSSLTSSEAAAVKKENSSKFMARRSDDVNANHKESLTTSALIDFIQQMTVRQQVKNQHSSKSKMDENSSGKYNKSRIKEHNVVNGHADIFSGLSTELLLNNNNLKLSSQQPASSLLPTKAFNTNSERPEKTSPPVTTCVVEEADIFIRTTTTTSTSNGGVVEVEKSVQQQEQQQIYLSLDADTLASIESQLCRNDDNEEQVTAGGNKLLGGENKSDERFADKNVLSDTIVNEHVHVEPMTRVNDKRDRNRYYKHSLVKKAASSIISPSVTADGAGDSNKSSIIGASSLDDEHWIY